MIMAKRKISRELARIIIGALLFVLALVFEHQSYSHIALCLFAAALAVSGFSVFLDAVRGILRRDFLDEKFLMSVASIGAFIIGEAEEGVAVMLFFLVGEWFEHIAVSRSRNSIKMLMEICPDTATVLRGDEESLEDAEDVEVGELIVIRSGERVPIDCVVVSGSSDIDTSALTGESVPRSVTIGDELCSGSVVIGGVLTCRTLRLAEESSAARVLELVENANERKSKEEAFITAFSKVYTPIVTALALLMAVLPPLFGWLEWNESVYRALSFLVVSCPCALVISVPMAFFGGIGRSARDGILFKGGNTFGPVSRPSSVVFDKTGTLTRGTLTVSSVNAVGMEAEELIRYAASAEYGSTHPVAECLKRAAGDAYPAEDITELAGKGVTAKVNSRAVAVGNAALMRDMGIDTPKGDGSVYVAIDGVLRGEIAFADEVKPEAASAVAELYRLGVRRTYILSGDRREKVEAVKDALGIDEIHTELLPEQKYARLEEIIARERGSVIYVGDGINDAPCLARADVGVAMGSMGSDSAIESADAVIMSDNLTRLPEAVRTARRTLRIAKENIIFALGIKIGVLALVSVSLAGMWMAVFADVGVAVLAILNSMRTLIAKRQTIELDSLRL